MTTAPFVPGNYRFMPGVWQYSGGVAAEPGYRMERVTFRRPVPLQEGFHRIAQLITAAGRPLTSFAACELRSPAPFSEAGFKAFNEVYVGTLTEWGLYRDGTNPVARANVCPEIGRPAGPSFHAFSYTVAAADASPSFVIAGSGECPEGKGSYREHTVALGDVSAAGLRRKAEWVLSEMARRMAVLDTSWDDVTAAQVYTVHNLHSILASTLAPSGAMRPGLAWHYCRPPVVDLEFEMDCRGVHAERLADA